MGTLIIDKKKFVVIGQKDFDKIQLLAAQKSTPVRKLSLAAGRKHARKLIDCMGKRKISILEPARNTHCRSCLVY
jgi:hypothetical protein